MCDVRWAIKGSFLSRFRFISSQNDVINRTNCTFSPPTFVFSSNKAHLTNKMLHMKQKDGFAYCTVSVLAESQKDLVAHFGYASGTSIIGYVSYLGDQKEKFAPDTPVKYTVTEHNVPIIEGAVWSIECKVVDIKTIGMF